MKCEAVENWLLTGGQNDPLPGSVRRHLTACARCRRRRRRLIQSESELTSAVMPECQTALARFLERIHALPSQEPAPHALPKAVLPFYRAAVYWAASVLFFAGIIGIALYVRQSEGPPDPPGNHAKPKEANPADNLVNRFVERDLILAGTVASDKQWHVMNEMADDLRAEAIRLADEQRPDDLPMVTSLYERVLKQGLIARVNTLPEKDRKEFTQNLAQHLRNHEKMLDQRLQSSSPNWVTLLQPLQKADRQSLVVLAANDMPPKPKAEAPSAIPGGSDYRRLLLSALVLHGIRLAEETDPLKRADCCSELADHLLQAIVTASVKGDHHNVSALGKNLGEFVDRGVSVNLARVPVNDPRVAELKDVMKRTNQIMLALDKTVEQMSAKDKSNRLDPASLDRLKDLEKMLKDVEKSLKKVHRAFKDAEKEREKEQKEKEGKGKAKDWSMSPGAEPFHAGGVVAASWLISHAGERRGPYGPTRRMNEAVVVRASC